MALNQGFNEIILDETLQNDFRAIFKGFEEIRANMQQKVTKRINNIAENVASEQARKEEFDKWLTSELSAISSTERKEVVSAFGGSGQAEWGCIAVWLSSYQVITLPSMDAELWAKMVVAEATAEGLL
jgi:hypothetical protein